MDQDNFANFSFAINLYKKEVPSNKLFQTFVDTGIDKNKIKMTQKTKGLFMKCYQSMFEEKSFYKSRIKLKLGQTG